MSADAMWDAAGRDAEAEQAEHRLAVARVRCASVSAFLAGARTLGEYDQRARLVDDQVIAAVDSVSPGDPLLLAEVHAGLLADWRLLAATRPAPAVHPRPAAMPAGAVTAITAGRQMVALRLRLAQVAALRRAADTDTSIPADLAPSLDPADPADLAESELAEAERLVDTVVGSLHTAPGAGPHAPYTVEHRGDDWVVLNDLGEVKGTHSSEAEARSQQEALYANVPGAREQAERKTGGSLPPWLDKHKYKSDDDSDSDASDDDKDGSGGKDDSDAASSSDGDSDDSKDHKDSDDKDDSDGSKGDSGSDFGSKSDSAKDDDSDDGDDDKKKPWKKGQPPPWVKGSARKQAEGDGSYWSVVNPGGGDWMGYYPSEDAATQALEALRAQYAGTSGMSTLMPDPAKFTVVHKPNLDAAASRGDLVSCGKCATGRTPDGQSCRYCDGVGALDYRTAAVKQAAGWGQGLVGVYHPEEYGSARYEDLSPPAVPSWIHDEWDRNAEPWTPGETVMVNHADGTELRQRTVGAANPYDPRNNPYQVPAAGPSVVAPEEYDPNAVRQQPGTGQPVPTAPGVPGDQMTEALDGPGRAARPPDDPTRSPRANAARAARAAFTAPDGPLVRMAAEALACNPRLSARQAWLLAEAAMTRYPQAAGRR